jgi:hypothetical protein
LSGSGTIACAVVAGVDLQLSTDLPHAFAHAGDANADKSGRLQNS